MAIYKRQIILTICLCILSRIYCSTITDWTSYSLSTPPQSWSWHRGFFSPGDNKIYIVGHSSNPMVYDIASQQWSWDNRISENQDVSLDGQYGTVVQGVFYFQDYDDSSHVYKFDPITPEWNMRFAPMQSGQGKCFTSNDIDTVYIIQNNLFKKLNVFATTPALEDGPNVPYTASMSQCAYYNGYIYLFGGSGRNEISKFHIGTNNENFNTETWQTLSVTMPINSLDQGEAVLAGDNIIYMGGFRTEPQKIYSFDPENEAAGVIEEASLNSPRQYGAVIFSAFDNRLYVIKSQTEYSNQLTATANPPVDCTVSEWGEYGQCTVLCGGGTQTRSRTINIQPENGGAACPELSETQNCNEQPCAIDCVVSVFSEWSTCTLLCGGGEQTRTRIITTHPLHGGEECDPLSEEQNCNTQSCCPNGINTFNWDTMIEEHINAPSFEDLVFGVDSTDLTLGIRVELPYLGKTSADNQREAKFGTTYVIDFEDFNAHSDAINKPGTCQNRMSSSFTGKSFNDFWTYSLEPQNTNGIGNLNTLSYPPSDKWSISMKNDGCDTIIYERSFTWQELRDCSGFNGEAFTSLIHEDNKYKLSGTMYINVVSPFWYDSDFGYYRVYQLLSKPFIITVSSTINVLGSTGINLITMWIIAVYKENQESDFRLVLMTETAEYLTLTRGAPNNEIFNFQKAISNTNNIDSNIFTVSNEPEAGCLNNRDYICTQLWNIGAINPGCTSGEGGIGTDFSGTYELGFTPQCKDTNDKDHCEQFLNDHIDIRDNLLIETNLVWKDDICEPELFELQFVANMLFYINDGFVDNTDIATVYNIAGTDKNTYLYQAGVDRIYVEINTDFPENTFEIFNTELTNVLICTFPPNILPKTFKDVIDPNQNVELNDMGCFNTQKDSSLSDIVNDIYPIPANNIADFTMHTEGETNIIRFSFLIPQEVTRDTLYIHAQIEVELQEAIPRRRILLDVNTANQISHFGQQVGVTNKNKNNKKPPINEPPINEPQLPINNPINISLKSPLVIIICSLLALILTVNICYMCYVNCYKNKTRKGKGYEKVKRIDSEFDIDSEAQMLDNQ